MKILAIDLGNTSSVACVYDRNTGDHAFETLQTAPSCIGQLVAEQKPDRVVIEAGPLSGWVCDVVRKIGPSIQVAKTTEQAWRWRNVKRKTDHDDALKLAQLSSLNQLRTVHVPEQPSRQWRSLIKYRQKLVERRTQIKNRIRAILLEQGCSVDYGTRYAWTKTHINRLRMQAAPIGSCGQSDLWRGMLHTELDLLQSVDQQVKTVEDKLDALGQLDHRVQLLQTIPGVGPRLAELIVAIIDRPERFTRGKQVACYTGLVPRQFQSGQAERLGRISRAGDSMLRGLLVEVSWMGLRYNPWMRSCFDAVCRGSKTRRKIAIVAVARKLVILCWAMLRDNQPWRPELVST